VSSGKDSLPGGFLYQNRARQTTSIIPVFFAGKRVLSKSNKWLQHLGQGLLGFALAIGCMGQSCVPSMTEVPDESAGAETTELINGGDAADSSSMSVGNQDFSSALEDSEAERVSLLAKMKSDSELLVAYSNEGVTIDGEISSGEWDAADIYVMDAADKNVPGVVVEGETVKPADASATLYLQHDGTYLYVGVVVTDDQVVGHADYVWNADCVELFLDADNSDTKNIGLNRLQFDVSAGGEQAATALVPSGSWDGSAARRAGGYTIEYRLSMADLGLEEGEVYGFDMAVNDVEPESGSVATRYWYFSSKEAASNESLWGDIHLGYASNAHPVVDAGADLATTTTEAITLRGSASDDGLPDPPGSMSIQWKQLSGPVGADIVNPQQAATKVSFDQAGRYEFEIVADDGELSSSDVAVVEVVEANDLQGQIIAPFSAVPVEVDGVADDSEWGDAADYVFNANDTQAPGVVVEGEAAELADSSAVIRVKYDADYVYVAVEVTDDQVVGQAANVWDADCVELFLDHDNSRMTNVGIGRHQFDISAGGQTLATDIVPSGSWTGSGRTNSNGYTVEYRLSRQALGLDLDGVYGFDLAISDVEPSEGIVETRYWYFSTIEAASDESSWGSIILQSVSNEPPSVEAPEDRTLVWPENSTRLAAIISDDGNPNPPSKLTIEWRQVSGPGTVVFSSPHESTTEATFDFPGEYILEIRAMDGEAEGNDQIAVTIQSAENQPPYVDAGDDQSVVWPTDTIQLTGEVSDDGLPLTPGEVTTTWTKESGPCEVAFTDAYAAETEVTFNCAGTYTLRLTADDGRDTSSDQVTIEVQSVSNDAPTVDAGGDQVLTWPEDSVVLSVQVEDDGYPNPPGALTLAWSKLSGPGAVSFTDAEAADTTVYFDGPGSYKLQIEADDGEFSTTDTVSVYILEEGALLAPFDTAKVSVDGTLADGEWDAAANYFMDGSDFTIPGVVVEGNTASLSDSSAEIYIKHSPSNVYVALVISDDNVVGQADYVWNADSVELFLDHDNSNTSSCGINRMQFDVAAGGETMATGAVPADCWEGAGSVTSDGYVVEYRLSKSDLGLDASGSYGFDIAISDVEPQAGTIATRYWYFATAEACDDESQWGDLTLQPAPVDYPLLAINTNKLDFGASDDSQRFEVWNAGEGIVSYSVSCEADWVEVTPLSGECDATKQAVTVTVDRSGLSDGTHEAEVLVDAGEAGSESVSVVAKVVPGTLAVNPTTGMNSSGQVGGPFTPGQMSYTLSNTGGQPIDWTVSKNRSWISLSDSSGTLDSGESVDLEVSINGEADDLSAGSYNDSLSFTSSGQGDTSRAVTLSVYDPGSGEGAPMTTASRTSGVAPLAVFFDTVGYGSGVIQPSNNDFSVQHYEWDFGDDASATWSTNGKSKNRAKGYLATHVYENPGVYNVCLSVTDAAGVVHKYEQSIRVSAFSGTTYYISSSSGSDNNDGLSPQRPFRSYGKAISVAGSYRRILFKRGDSWTIGGSQVIGSSGPGIIGAYGSGPDPVIYVTGERGAFDMRGDDWRIMDMKLVGPGSSSQVAGIEGSGLTRFLALRVDVSRFRVGIAYGWTGAQQHNENVIADCDVSRNVINNGYVGGKRIAVLGSNFSSPDVSHCLRVWHIRKGVISNNTLHNPGGDRLALKFHNEVALSLPDSQHAVISDNSFRGHAYVVSIAPQWWGGDERIEQVIFERNELLAMSDTFLSLLIEAQQVTVRNNVCLGDGTGPYYKGISVSNSVAPGSARHKVVNNTIYRGESAKEFTGIEVSGGDCIVRNNLASAPATSWVVFISGGGYVADHNLITDQARFANPGAGDLSLLSGSPARDAGVPLSAVRDSFNGVMRPAGGGYDIGAYEQ